MIKGRDDLKYLVFFPIFVSNDGNINIYIYRSVNIIFK